MKDWLDKTDEELKPEEIDEILYYIRTLEEQ
jgi:hypothetical protein